MASYRQKLEWWTGRRCSGPLASLELLGRYPVRVQPELVDAVAAMHRELVAAGYRNPTGPTGSYFYRTIGGLDVWSEHAYGTAVDVDYFKNRHLHKRIYPQDPAFGTEFMFLEHQIRAIEAIRNTEGQRIWGWLGWAIGDSMHFYANVRPEDTTVDWSTVYTSTMNLHALVDAAFDSGNPAVGGNRAYWHALADTNPHADEWYDLFKAMLTPVPMPDHGHEGTVEVS